MRTWLYWAFLCAWTPCAAIAHIGNTTVISDGRAGPYAVRVVVRPPPVIPGLAEISVRVGSPGVDGVTVLPVVWNAGRKGAPPPDRAVLVPGETNLYSAQLWLMVPGAHSVFVDVSGPKGIGTAIVPVDAVATRRIEMGGWIQYVLAGMGALLVLMLVTLARGAFREAILPPGIAPDRKARRRGNIACALAVPCILGALYGGKRWWDAEDARFRDHRLYQTAEVDASVHFTNNAAWLQLTRPQLRQMYPIVPDHGKLMHAFLIRVPAQDAFAHLHPRRRAKETFEAPLPPLPRGKYQIYADVTYESGASDTLVGEVHLENDLPDSRPTTPGDPDDSFVAELPPVDPPAVFPFEPVRVSAGYRIEGRAGSPIAVSQPADLEFRLLGPDGSPVPLEPSMGMAGHLVIRHADGSVFSHVHPAGTFSMASQQLFELRASGKAPERISRDALDPLCLLPGTADSAPRWLGGSDPARGLVRFPYAFPKPGAYRGWVQVKANGTLTTFSFSLALGARPDFIGGR